MAKILGIDLGTTNSAMAVMEGSEPEILVNAEGDRTTPSVEGFRKDGERVVGKAAKNQAVTNPENTVSSVKRFIGRAFAETAEEQKTVSYNVKSGKDGRAVVSIEGKDYTPEEISAMVLQKMKNDAEKQLGAVFLCLDAVFAERLKILAVAGDNLGTLVCELLDQRQVTGADADKGDGFALHRIKKLLCGGVHNTLSYSKITYVIIILRNGRNFNTLAIIIQKC